MRTPILTFVLLILGTLYVVLFSPAFKIKNVNFSGDSPSCTSIDEIKKVSGVVGQTYFSLDSSKLEKKIKDKFICIRAVTTHKIIPDKVNLELRKRVAALTIVPFEASNSAYLIDDEGVIFSEDRFETNQPKVFLSGEEIKVSTKLNGEIVIGVLQVLDKLKTLNIEIKNPKIYDSNVFSVGEAQRFIFSLGGNLNRQLASLQLILDQAKIDTKEVELVDLRFDKPVVMFNPKK